MARIGPYQLQERLGEGGMAEVWRAWHRGWRLPVALKVLRSQLGEVDAEALRQEVRLVAGLSHPGIVRVLDQGEVPEGGPFPPGSPYLVMELLRGGTLGLEVGRMDWPRLRWVLLRLLDALAHAHAHGVIHRDLKPANVLRDGGGVRVVLSDFGISGLLDEVRDEADILGTPAYMAPEQLLGAWREQGPWTDLYSLAATAWHLATGAHLFGQGQDAMQGQMRQEPGPFQPVHPCPPGLEAWLRRLLRKRPAERYQRAAEAAAALAELPLAVAEAGPVSTGSSGEPAPAAVIVSPGRLLDAPTLVLQPVVGEEAPTHPGGPAEVRPLPLPRSWRVEATDASLSRSRGRGLVGMRTPRLVGREAERDALWAALHEVVDSGQTRALVLRGAAGVGKSRLAWWLCTRAHELGAASVLVGRHSEDEPDGLGGMVARSVHGLGLEGEALLKRVEQELPGLTSDDQLGLVGLVRPGQGLRLSTSTWRGAVLLRWLRARSAVRPQVVWLDDAHWSLQSLELVRLALDRGCGPVLFVLTVQDEGLARAAEARELLDELAAPALRVEPLAEAETWELVSELLGLAPALAGEVADRCAGNPLLAIQLVADQVARDQLVVGEAGLELREGARLELPADLDELWSERLGAALQGEDRRPFELAALLGAEVEWELLWRACEELGLRPVGGAFRRLFRDNLLVAEGRHAFRFAHGMLREVLLRQVRAGGSWQRLHGACADALEGLDGDDLLARRARHLVEAGRLEAALEPLEQAAERQCQSGRHGAAARLLGLREQALHGLSVPPEDPRWGRHRCLELEILSESGALGAAQAGTTRLLDEARRQGWDHTLACALQLMGSSLRTQGRPREARALFDEAVAAFRVLGDTGRQGRALTELGDARTDLGDLDGAERAYAEARSLLEPLGAGRDLGRVYVGLAQLARQRRDWEAARAWMLEGRAAYASDGNRWGEAVVCNDLADYARRQGRLDEALAGFREARQIQISLGLRPLVPEINLGLTLAEQGRHDEALAALERLEGFLDAWRRANFAAHVRAGMLRSLAVQGREADFGVRLLKLEDFLGRSGLAEEELAHFLEEAAAAALDRGWAALARRAEALARVQHRRLGSAGSPAESQGDASGGA